MHASVVSFQVQSGQYDECVRILNGMVSEMKRIIKGWQGGYALTDRTAHKVMIIGFYESEAAASEIENSGQFRQVAAQHIMHIVVPGSMERHLYEVLIPLGLPPQQHNH